MEAATVIPPPPVGHTGELPELSWGSEKVFFFHFSFPFDPEFALALAERLESYGWLRRSAGTKIGEPYSHFGDGGFFPTSKAAALARFHGLDESMAGVVSAMLGPTLTSPADCAFILGVNQDSSILKLAAFYGIPTLSVSSFKELEKLINPFIERNNK